MATKTKSGKIISLDQITTALSSLADADLAALAERISAEISCRKPAVQAAHQDQKIEVCLPDREWGKAIVSVKPTAKNGMDWVGPWLNAKRVDLTPADILILEIKPYGMLPYYALVVVMLDGKLEPVAMSQSSSEWSIDLRDTYHELAALDRSSRIDRSRELGQAIRGKLTQAVNTAKDRAAKADQAKVDHEASPDAGYNRLEQLRSIAQRRQYDERDARKLEDSIATSFPVS